MFWGVSLIQIKTYNNEHYKMNNLKLTTMKETQKVTIVIEQGQIEQRKELKEKHKLPLETLDKWIYSEGVNVVSKQESLFDRMAAAFNPKNK